MVPGVTLMPGQAQKEAQAAAAAAGKGDAPEKKADNGTMESVQEQPTEEMDDLEME